MKNIIISGYYGFGNTGDEAILSSMINQIRRKIDDCNFIVISNNIDATKRLHDVEAINRLDFIKITQEIAKADLVILGGGCLFQDNNKIDISHIFDQPGGGVASYAIVPLIAKMYNKRVLFYAQGIGPLFTEESKTFVFFVSKLADAITVRDDASANLLTDIGVSPSRIFLGIDPAFALEIPSDVIIRNILTKENIDTDKRMICVSVRWWDNHDIEEKYIELLKESLDSILDFHEDHILFFVPFQEISGGSDTDMSKRIIDKMTNKSRCYLLEESYSPECVAGIFSKASLVIGMRYHSIIFSILSKIPFVAIPLSYDVKVKSLIDELGLRDYCVDIDHIDSRKLVDTINSALAYREEIVTKMVSFDIKERLDISPRLVKSVIQDTFVDRVYDNMEIPTVQKEKIVLQRYYQKLIFSLDSQLKEKNNEILEKNNEILEKNNEILEKNNELHMIQDKLYNVENSLSWRLGQSFGKYFGDKSYITRFTTYMINNISCCCRDKNVDKSINDLNDILRSHKNIKGVIVYPPTVDWNIPLFQRPHHLANNLSENYLYFFCTKNIYDNIDGFCKLKDNCYLTNKYDLLTQELTDFILFISSSNHLTSLESIAKIKDKTLVIYEHMDDISIDIFGPDFPIEDVMIRHHYLIENADIILASADKLLDEVMKIRQRNVYYVPNAVDYDHFHIGKNYNNVPTEILPVISKGNPIIGYHGALAKWFDYDIIKKLAKERPNYEIILIGWDYDNTLKSHGLENFKNVHYLGIKEYAILPKYAVWYDVSIIPFVLNSITESTSPIKIFEYMAIGKPIVTTNIRECRKYKSILVAKDAEDFVAKIDDAIGLKTSSVYMKLLDNDAKDNTWKLRSKLIDEAITTVKLQKMEHRKTVDKSGKNE